MEINTIQNMDVIEFLRALPNGYANMCYTDPPYNWKKDIQNDNMEWDKFEEWLTEVFKELYRVMKQDSFIVVDIPRTKLMLFQKIICKHFEFYDYLCNFVNNSMANCGVGIDRFNLKIMAKKGNPKVKNRRSNVVVTQRYAGFDFKHPTQKDPKCYAYIIKMLTNKDDLVIDPFCGSGTTALACKKFRRNYLVNDIEQNFCKITEERLLKIQGSRIDDWVTVETQTQTPPTVESSNRNFTGNLEDSPKVLATPKPS